MSGRECPFRGLQGRQNPDFSPRFTRPARPGAEGVSKPIEIIMACAAGRISIGDGRYWARTSDPQLVEYWRDSVNRELGRSTRLMERFPARALGQGWPSCWGSVPNVIPARHSR